jgi:uncharacterized protein involved in response to NO
LPNWSGPPLSESPVPLVRPQLALFALGFRPFFLAAGVLAATAVPLWLAVLGGLVPAMPALGGAAWHAETMLFGYGSAVVAGFLLTAVRNWTGMATASGVELAALLALWLAGRIAPWLPLPGSLAGALAGALPAVLDVAFPLALALSLRAPLWSGPNRANRVFLALLGGMAAASLLFRLGALGALPGGALAGERLMLGLLVATLLVVAGRIMPFFTRSAIAGAAPRVRPWVERLTVGLAAAWIAVDLATGAGPLAGALALALALVQAIRLWGWHHRGAWAIPILAVLYLGYSWLILGLGLAGLAGLGVLAPFPSLHALTVGALGVFTLGMMSRVTLGHTGRPMGAAPLMRAAFVAINLAALTRVFGPLLWPSAYWTWLICSGLLWTLAFVAFLWVHGPMLVAPRADGHPG